MNLWPRFVRERWERREREAEVAEALLVEAHATHARVGRLAAEATRLKRENGFAEAIRTAMGVQR